jgi:hypothetical protein
MSFSFSAEYFSGALIFLAKARRGASSEAAYAVWVTFLNVERAKSLAKPFVSSLKAFFLIHLPLAQSRGEECFR